MPGFVHLHTHSEYSLLDGACRLKEMAAYAKSLGQTALALTDHGNMYGAVEFYLAAQEAGIKPIIGCEVYVAPRTRFQKEFPVDSSPYHLILLCMNNTGYHNLVKLVSMGYVEGFYSKPRVDIEILRAHCEGLICMSACLGGEIPRKLRNGDFQGAKDTALLYADIFGPNNFFLELQNHFQEEDAQVIPLLQRLSRETGIPMAAANDAHYIHKEDWQVQEVLLAIGTNTTIDQPSNLRFPTQEFYLKSAEEMLELFPHCPQALENTAAIAERCNVTFEFGQIRLPKFHMDGVTDNVDFFHSICRDGLKNRYGSPSKEAAERLEYELSVITNMGYVDYFLIVWDFIRYAKQQNIPVGPGRGSGAGSLAAYCIGITGVDPLEYQLLFERFLNPERVSMPDFDIDFCYEGRQQVIDYVVRKYGSDRVAQIITFGTMAAKAAIRDVGRALGMPYQLVDSVAKMIPFELSITLNRAMESSEELRERADSDPLVKRLLDTARKVEGMPRHASTHAAGVVIASAPVSEFVPLQKNDDVIVTQYTMNILEQLGMLKMDFLGLRYLTVIRDTLRFIGDSSLNLETLPLTDKSTYELISRGDTNGVFQLESGGMKQVLQGLKPDRIEDMVAVLSLYRPGPMDSIPKYIANRHDPSLVTYKTPLLENILKVTYGCIIYQEQVMEIFRTLAGYSYGRADLVRRAMAKKKRSLMEKERQSFIYGGIAAPGQTPCLGCVANGISPDVAEDIFQEMSSFASYAFNKSHSAAYALLTYQTAYLKCHFYPQYMAALLTSVMDYTGKLLKYTNECRAAGVPILTPDINESEEGFFPTAQGIRFALSAIKNLGRGAVRELVAERRTNGKYLSFEDFCRRMKGKELSRKGLESLIQTGALDAFGYTRRQLMEGYEQVFEGVHDEFKRNLEGQIDLFGADSSAVDDSPQQSALPYVPEYPYAQLLEMEKSLAGLYLSGHPLEPYLYFANCSKFPDVAGLEEDFNQGLGHYKDGALITILGSVQKKTPHITKAGAKMCFSVFEDMTGSIEVIFFPKIWESLGSLIIPGEILAVTGKISAKDDELKILAEKAVSGENFIAECCKKQLWLKLRSDNESLMNQLLTVIKSAPGKTPILLYLEDLKRKVVPKGLPGVNLDPKLLSALVKLLGPGNCAFK